MRRHFALLLTLSALSVAACGPPDAGTPVAIEDLAAAETPGSVLVWRLTFTTSSPTNVIATVEGEEGQWKVDGTIMPRAEHDLFLTGLRAGSDYDVTVEATNFDGLQANESVSFTTGELPAELPPISVDVSKPVAMAEGFTLFNVFRWLPGENAPDSETGWLLVVDAEGEIVWYAILDHRTDDAQIKVDGNLIYVRPNDEIVELDRSGSVVRRWVATGLREEVPEDAIEVDVDTFHHEIEVLPNGNFLTLSTELREITTEQCPNYEPSSGDSLNVVGDVIVEFEPSSGEVVQTISTFDALDPCRRTDRGFEAGFWNGVYGGRTTQDWTHGNAVFFDTGDDLALVSLRHQDWVVAYRFTPGNPELSGEVAWVLGQPDADGGWGGHPGFEPDGEPFAWQYHQHAPMITADGTLLMYDNGNLRPGTSFEAEDDRPYTRAVEYRLRPGKGTVEQVWQWESPLGGYAPFVGDADALPNGNVLVTDGGILDPPSDAVRSPMHRKLARISEVSPGDDEVVFQLTVEDDSADPTGYTVYRAERVTGFPRE